MQNLENHMKYNLYGLGLNKQQKWNISKMISDSEVVVLSAISK